MQQHNLISDETFEELFEQCLLDPTIFTHEAHLRLAWIHINKYGIECALIRVPHQLKAYVHSLGVTDKYNATLTTAAIKAVYHFMLKSNAHSIRNIPELQCF